MTMPGVDGSGLATAVGAARAVVTASAAGVTGRAFDRTRTSGRRAIGHPHPGIRPGGRKAGERQERDETR